jgi:DNA-binding NarL/FixJ family response regulator
MAAAATTRVLLAGGQPIFLRGLRSILEAEREFHVVASCSDGGEALEAIAAHQPDIVVSGVHVRGFEGLGLLREIRRRQLAVPVVVMASRLGEKDLLEAVTLGVNGVLLEEMLPALVIRCLRKVSAGGHWFEHESVRGVLELVIRREAGRRKAAQELTARELELVCKVAEGLRNKDIAKQLKIAEATVKTHLRNIYKKLNCDTRVALRRYAEERGLV